MSCYCVVYIDMLFSCEINYHGHNMMHTGVLQYKENNLTMLKLLDSWLYCCCDGNQASSQEGHQVLPL